MKWTGEPFNKIITAGCEDDIYVYDLELKQEFKTTDRVHTNHIMDLLPISKMGYLVSCGMDGKVVLWNIVFADQGQLTSRREESKGSDGLPNRKVKI